MAGSCMPDCRGGSRISWLRCKGSTSRNRLDSGLLRASVSEHDSKLLGGRVHVVDLSLGIGGDHRFANGRQRDFGAFFLALQRVFDFFAVGGVSQ